VPTRHLRIPHARQAVSHPEFGRLPGLGTPWPGRRNCCPAPFPLAKKYRQTTPYAHGGRRHSRIKGKGSPRFCETSLVFEYCGRLADCGIVRKRLWFLLLTLVKVRVLFKGRANPPLFLGFAKTRPKTGDFNSDSKSKFLAMVKFWGPKLTCCVQTAN